jgi:hypothetical protein
MDGYDRMKRLEIISVRTSGMAAEQARSYMKTFCRDVATSLPAKAGLYLGAADTGDLAVVLHWQEKAAVEGKSATGLFLADTLRRFGLVEHVFWITMDDRDPRIHG